MSTFAMVWGLLSLVGMIIAFFPCLGSLNWINIPFASIGLIISIIAMNSATSENRSKALSGVVLCAVAIFLGIFRLILGAGVF